MFPVVIFSLEGAITLVTLRKIFIIMIFFMFRESTLGPGCFITRKMVFVVMSFLMFRKLVSDFKGLIAPVT